MATIHDSIECPNCGQEADETFFYKTGEEIINCRSCGYHRSARIISREKKLTELTDADWEMIEIKDPYGSYEVKFKNEVSSTCGTIENEDEFKSLYEVIKACEDPVEFFTVSKLVEGKIMLTNYPV